MAIPIQYTLDLVLNIVKLGGRFATLVGEAITLRLLVGKAKLQLEGIQLSSLLLKLLKPLNQWVNWQPGELTRVPHMLFVLSMLLQYLLLLKTTMLLQIALQLTTMMLNHHRSFQRLRLLLISHLISPQSWQVCRHNLLPSQPVTWSLRKTLEVFGNGMNKPLLQAPASQSG